jgi:hypothetical protein
MYLPRGGQSSGMWVRPSSHYHSILLIVYTCVYLQRTRILVYTKLLPCEQSRIVLKSLRTSAICISSVYFFKCRVKLSQIVRAWGIRNMPSVLHPVITGPFQKWLQPLQTASRRLFSIECQVLNYAHADIRSGHAPGLTKRYCDAICPDTAGLCQVTAASATCFQGMFYSKRRVVADGSTLCCFLTTPGRPFRKRMVEPCKVFWSVIVQTSDHTSLICLSTVYLPCLFSGNLHAY